MPRPLSLPALSGHPSGCSATQLQCRLWHCLQSQPQHSPAPLVPEEGVRWKVTGPASPPLALGNSSPSPRSSQRQQHGNHRMNHRMARVGRDLKDQRGHSPCRSLLRSLSHQRCPSDPWGHLTSHEEGDPPLGEECQGRQGQLMRRSPSQHSNTCVEGLMS